MTRSIDVYEQWEALVSHSPTFKTIIDVRGNNMIKLQNNTVSKEIMYLCSVFVVHNPSAWVLTDLTWFIQILVDCQQHVMININLITSKKGSNRQI